MYTYNFKTKTKGDEKNNRDTTQSVTKIFGTEPSVVFLPMTINLTC
jgi:hypothetical protein